MITTKWVIGDNDLSDSLEIRKKVFVEEQNVPLNIEIDGLDDSAHHIILYEDNIPVATGRLLIDKDEYLIGRIAVLKQYRKKYLGDLVVRMLVRKAFDLGASEVNLHSQAYAQKFYEKLGFKSYGEVYMEAGIEHISMIRKK